MAPATRPPPPAFRIASFRLAAGFAACLLVPLAGCRPDDRSAAAGRAERADPGDGAAPEAGGPEAKGGAPGDEVLFDSLPAGAKPRLPPGLKDFQQIFADVAEKAIPAVVSIYSERNIALPGNASRYDDFLDNGPFQYFFGPPGSRNPAPRPHKETGLGSGVIISPSGYILTNNHVIEGADLIKVQLYDEVEYVAAIVGTDKPSDMAVIKIKAKADKLPTLPLGSSQKLRIGEWVIAVGNPYGLSHTVTTGIISAKGRKNTGINSYENFIQTDAAINPGNSGGALMNLSGELIGINTAIFSRSGGYQGIGFAIPIDMAKKITQDLIRDGEVTRGWLGVSIQPIGPELAEELKLRDRKGALVGGVVPGSPADKAGIKRGDVITKVGDLEIKDANDLLNRIALLIPNDWVEVWVIREGITLNFKTRIAKRDEKRLATTGNGGGEDGDAAAAVGVKVDGLSRELRERFDLDKSLKRGVVVVAVEAEGRGAAARLREGDVILEINRISIQDVQGFRAAMSQAGKGNKILVLVNRKGNNVLLTL
ncbi:MAG TPA: Do family serine endopeptidase [Fibrobacteria bacterium]|nr:Do family serine endopeptidase [Fibrobacteria bacterium]